MYTYIIVSVVLLASLYRCQELPDPVDVETQYGPVTGQSQVLYNGKTVNSFLGIPYASAPILENRFQRPQPPDPWFFNYEADAIRSACEQSRVGTIWLTHPGWLNYDEDCLHLNIYTPYSQTNGPYAVMVFLHGGAYQSSANIQYPGYFLAAEDVIVVVPNYRLGIFGFVTTGDSVSPGNNGMWDQLMALQFVRDNIAAFGGDPNRVTVFGQSAGAGSTGLMLVSPHAAGLFNQAILQSGSELAVWAINHPDSDPASYTRTVAEELFCPTDNNRDMMDCLTLQDADDLRLATFNCTPGYICLGMQPVVDGDFLPDLPQTLREQGRYNRATLMAGTTAEDGSLYVPVVVPEDIDMDVGINRTEYERIMRRVADYLGNRWPDRTEDMFQAFMFYYTQQPWANDRKKNARELVMMATDFAFIAQQDYHLRWHTQEDTTYSYIFGYRSSSMNDSIIPDWMGTTHMLEIPYVFGHPLIRLCHADLREESEIEDVIDWNDEDVEWAEYTIKLWANFAKVGNPTPTPIVAPGGTEAQTWPEYQHGQFNTFKIDWNATNIKDHRQQAFAFWTRYMSYMTDQQIQHPGGRAASASEPEYVLKGNAISQYLDEFFYNMAKEKFGDDI